MSADSSRSVSVSGLDASSTEHSIKTFFSFCGTVESLKKDGSSATIVFERAGAAKTASFLNGASLDGSTISVKWAGEGTEVNEPATATGHAHDDVRQEDKPRSAVAAEYLAAGYHLSDNVIAQSIDLDNKHGISQKFSSFWTPLAEKAKQAVADLDEKHRLSEQASQKAKETDETYKISEKAASATSIGKAYYSRALASSWGQQVSQFYTSTAQRVSDVHAEARRIADSKKPATASSAPETSAPTATGSETTTAPPHAAAPGISQAPVTDVK